MPSTGSAPDNSRGSMLGAPASYTLAGPPERITPITFLERSSASVTSWERISQYTRDSRTRRAMSCVYWDPKSRIAIVARCDGPVSAPVSERIACDPVTPRRGPALARLVRAPDRTRSSVRAHSSVVRGFGRNANVVGMRFAKSCSRDAHEARLRAQLVDVRGTDVLHARTQPTDELMHERTKRSDRADLSLDALRDQLREVANLGLSVAVARPPGGHRAERPHPAV